jgi:hypothetical protein
VRPRQGQRQERVVVESASECLGWSASREGAAKDSKSKGIGVARVTYGLRSELQAVKDNKKLENELHKCTTDLLS